MAKTGLFSRLFGGGRLASEETPGPSDDYWYGEAAGGSAAGVKISADSALKVSVVFRCVTILADMLASVPLQMFRVEPDESLIPAPTHPLDDVLRIAPNNWQTPAEFWGMMGFHAALRGVAYAEIVPGRRGAVDQLIPHHPNAVNVEVMRDRTMRFRVHDQFTGETKVLLQEEMLRIPGITQDGFHSINPVLLASEAIGLLVAADQYAARVFSNRLNIGGFLIHPGKPSLEAQKRLIERLRERFSGPQNFHRPTILAEGMKFEKASMDAKDAQLLEARKWQIGDIARNWGIPLHMLGIDDQTNRSTVEEQSLNFVRVTVRPWINRVEQAIRRDLITVPRLYRAVFDLDDLERGNMQARADYFAKALGSGGAPPWLTQNEVRRAEGWNRIDDPRADRLAIGTNPGTAETIQAAIPALPAPDEPPSAIEVDDAGQRGERLARRENKAIRRAAVKHAADPDALRSWIKAFYAGHVSSVMEILGISKTAARAYCAFQADEALRANDLSGLLDRREDSLAATIAETLRRNGDQHG